MPEKSKRLKVIDRIEDVLRAIQEGDDFWASPKEVHKATSRTIEGYPAYIIGPETGGDIAMELDQQNEETFYIAVEGWVKEEQDIVTPLEHAIQDVQHAINDDFRSGASADSLIGLASNVFFDAPPEIEYFEGENGYFARFKQRIKIQIYGEFGEL